MAEDTRLTVCVDLDGVLAEYSGWLGPDHFGLPRPGAMFFLIDLGKLGYRVVVFSTRDPEKVRNWLWSHHMDTLVALVTQKKEPAVAYIDDRGICFRGNFEQTLWELRNFNPHWKGACSTCDHAGMPEERSPE